MARRNWIWTLAVLNLLLTGILLWELVPDNAAHAQPRRQVDDYVIVPGTLGAGTGGVIFVVNASNGMLGTGVFDGNKTVNSLPPLDLNAIFNQSGGIVPGGGVKRPGGVR